MELRSTFRSKQTVTAWQKKIRDDIAASYTGYRFFEHINLSLKKAVVKEIDRKTAEKIILTYEWLGDMAITNKYYGIFFENYCGGCICINTNGVCPGNGKAFGLKDSQISYFARGACAFWTPTGSASKLLSFALKLERERGSKMAIAYADSDAGEYGTVYQATNWLFLGKQTSTSYQYVKGNKIIDSRSISQKATQSRTTIKKYEQALTQAGWLKQPTNAKYRYIYILDETYRAIIMSKIGKLITEYPKRNA